MTPEELPHDKIAYLATPFTRYPAGTYMALSDAAEIAAKLLVAGVKVYSPICHCGPIATHGNLDPLDLSIWLPFDEAMMHCASILIVAHMEGWDRSEGIAHEIEIFRSARKPIFDLDPDTMALTRRR